MAKKETSTIAKKKAVTPKKKPTVKKVDGNKEKKTNRLSTGFPKGNRFWELRSKIGRDRLFKTPEILYEEACKYFEWCTDNPLVAEELIKSGDLAGFPSFVNKMRPFTYQGLTNYLDCNVDYFNDFEDSLRGKTDENSIAFSRVLKRIRQIIYQQKFEGASSGFFNPMIISRDLGLKDSVDQNVKADVKSEVNVTQQSKVEITLPDNQRGIPNETKE